MTSHSLPGAARLRILGATAAAAAGATGLAGILFAATAGAAGVVASSTLVDLTLADAPVLHLNPFSGTYGAVTVDELGGTHDSAFADPDGVLNHISIAGPKTSQVSSTSGKNYARGQLIGLTGGRATPGIRLAMNGHTLLSVASFDSYAECTPPPVGPYALAYVHTDGNAVQIAGHTVPVGTSTVPVTGADIGVPAVATGTLTVVYTQSATPFPEGQTPGASSAHAYLELKISGVFKDSTGKQVYDGPVSDLKLGDVKVMCPEAGPTSPSTPTETATTPTTAPTAPTTPPTAPTTVPTNGSGTPTTHPTHPPRPPHPTTGGGGSGGGGEEPTGGGDLPSTGGPSAWWPAMSALGIVGGAALYFGGRRRTRQTRRSGGRH